MDGPNVNFKLVDLLQKEHAELYGGAQVVTVGSCGLHTVYNALKAGFTMWQLEKLLRAMHFLFHNVPARREDFTSLTGPPAFPCPFFLKYIFLGFFAFNVQDSGDRQERGGREGE